MWALGLAAAVASTVIAGIERVEDLVPIEGADWVLASGAPKTFGGVTTALRLGDKVWAGDFHGQGMAGFQIR